MSQLPMAFGPYALLKLLAKGGMGQIYLAKQSGHNDFEKFYALKRLLGKFADDEDVKARFIDEAKLGARLHHPNIVQIHDLGVVGKDLYMSTEFVDGFDLRRVLRYCHEKKKRIPLDIALLIVREVLSGLAYAHRQVDATGRSINLIHRDISPQNVLVSFEGEVKVIDFGLAKSTQRSKETQANVLLGNFGYMSPEQARGLDLDLRTDLYSAAIVLFELITGTKRFVDENPLRLLEMVARPTPILPSDRMPNIPKVIDRIYERATSPKRDRRPPSAEAFRDELNDALYRLNPHTSRENLAQFLNHLFLGGEAPPQVDNDVLDQSMAVKVSTLLEESEAFASKKQDDVVNRTLTGFEDDGIQTGTNNQMRAARVGDTFSHSELTGEDESKVVIQRLATSAKAQESMPLVAQAAPVAEVDETLRYPPARALSTQELLPPDEAALEYSSEEASADDEPTVVGAEHSFDMREPLSIPAAGASEAAESFGNPIEHEPVVTASHQVAGFDAAATGKYEAPQWSGAPTHPPTSIPSGNAVVSELRSESVGAEDAPSMMVDFGDFEPVNDYESLPAVDPNLSGADSESLIIDFDLNDDEPEEAPALEDLVEVPKTESSNAAPAIRPAAKPLGRTVSNKVALPRQRREDD